MTQEKKKTLKYILLFSIYYNVFIILFIIKQEVIKEVCETSEEISSTKLQNVEEETRKTDEENTNLLSEESIIMEKSVEDTSLTITSGEKEIELSPEISGETFNYIIILLTNSFFFFLNNF